MRSLLRGERQGSLGVVLGLVAVICLAAYALAMALGWRSQFYELKHTIYQRCTQREAYDQASQQGRRSMVDLYRTLEAQERSNPFIDERLRTERRRAYMHAVAGLSGALRTGAPTGCSQYR